MEITKQQRGDLLELRVAGRLDAYWADHLAGALQDAVRGGADRIRVDLSEVNFLSSAGLRALLQCYQQLRAIQGSFAVCRPSAPVREVLEMAGFDALLVTEDSPAAATAVEAATGDRLDLPAAALEVFTQAPGGTLRCRALGDPERLRGCAFDAGQAEAVAFPDTTFAVGLGAFGASFDDCRNRFGEFLAAAGSAAYLPTDGTNVPDYLAAAGTFVPQLQVLYGLVCEGTLARLARFEAKPGVGAGSLSALAEACLGRADAAAAGIVMVAESAGLVGATLRRSPALGGSMDAPFGFPEVREWLSFTAERAFPRSLALVAGVVRRDPRSGMRDPGRA